MLRCTHGIIFIAMFYNNDYKHSITFKHKIITFKHNIQCCYKFYNIGFNVAITFITFMT